MAVKECGSDIVAGESGVTAEPISIVESLGRNGVILLSQMRTEYSNPLERVIYSTCRLHARLLSMFWLF